MPAKDEPSTTYGLEDRQPPLHPRPNETLTQLLEREQRQEARRKQKKEKQQS